MTLTYAVVTPARDEAENILRLAGALAAQTIRPIRWAIVDNGSTDETPRLTRRLATEYDWVTALASPGTSGAIRGHPLVLALQTGVAAVDMDRPDIVVKLDADVSFEADFFERILAAFERDERLGIAGGVCFEPSGGRWIERPVTAADSVWGAARAYRRACMWDVFPLEPGLGHDVVDLLKAELAGWKTGTVDDAHFLHFRPEGQRDGSRWRAWLGQGDFFYYMDYRWTWLLVRTFNRMRSDIHAFGMLWGYVAAALRRRQKYPDMRVRRLLRSKQRARHFAKRFREARSYEAARRRLPYR